MQKNKSKQLGFTIVEVLVATAVFVTVLVVALDLLLIFSRGQMEKVAEKQLEDEMIYFMEEGIDNLRYVELDYDRYSGTNPDKVLYFFSAGKDYTLARGDHPDFIGLGLDANRVYLYDGIDAKPLTGHSTNIEELQFWVYPQTDPFDLSAPSVNNHQPMIVVYVRGSSVTTLEYQKAITTRWYER